MTIQTINTATPNSGKGDSLFSAFTKINDNFGKIYEDYISKEALKEIVADSSDFDDFKARIQDL